MVLILSPLEVLGQITWSFENQSFGTTSTERSLLNSTSKKMLLRRCLTINCRFLSESNGLILKDELKNEKMVLKIDFGCEKIIKMLWKGEMAMKGKRDY